MSNENNGNQLGRPIDEFAAEWEREHPEPQQPLPTVEMSLGESLRRFSALFNAPADNLDEIRELMIKDLGANSHAQSDSDSLTDEIE